MKQAQTLDTYESSTYGKECCISKAKVGKTTFLIGSILGVMPWQEYGGIVDKPENLHVISFDAAAVDGVKEFLVNECGASKEIGKVHIENLQRAAEKAFAGRGDYDGEFLNTFYDTVKKIQDLTSKPGVHCVLISSVTMAAKAVLRSISGPAFQMNGNTMKKSPMDRNKWGLMSQVMTELQWQVQSDRYHTIWEAHHGDKVTKETDGKGDPVTLDSIQIDGSTARSFPAQVERIWEIKRVPMKYMDPKTKKPTKVDTVYFDPFPRFDFGDVQTGRKVSSRLEPKEPDLTHAFNKLGLKVGQWGA